MNARINKGFRKEYKRLKLKTFIFLLGNKLLEFVAQIILLIAITMAPVALVAVFGGLQSFFVLIEMVILSTWFPNILKEDISKKNHWQKIFSLVLIFTGIVILSQA